jgi:hypothetical protein
MVFLTVHRPRRLGTKSNRRTVGNHHTKRMGIKQGFGANAFRTCGSFQFIKDEEHGKIVWRITFEESLSTKRVWICQDRFSKLRDARETVERNLHQFEDSHEFFVSDMFWEIDEGHVVHGIIDGLLIFKNKGKERFKIQP